MPQLGPACVLWSRTLMRVKAQPRPGPPREPATPVQAGRITIPQRLNNVPHQRETRQFFYQDACAAVRNAVSARQPLLSVKWAALPPLLQSQGRIPNAYWV